MDTFEQTLYNIRLVKFKNTYQWVAPLDIPPENYSHVKIATWKGDYILRVKPTKTKLIHGQRKPPQPKSLSIVSSFQDISTRHPLLIYGFVHNMIGGKTMRQVTMKFFHPIHETWIELYHSEVKYCAAFAIRKIHNDIKSWIISQPLQPDYKQAEKDRVDVEQTFSEM